MKKKKILFAISSLMLIIALIYISVALTHPELGVAFYIGDFYFGAKQWRACYLIYIFLMTVLFAWAVLSRPKDK